MTASTTEKPAAGNDTAIEVVSHSPVNVRTGKSVARLETDVAHYPEPIRNEVVWLQGFLLDHCHNNMEALRAIAQKIGTDKSREYFSNLIGGSYFTNKPSRWQEGGRAWTEFLDFMSSLRRYGQQAARIGQIPFSQDDTYRTIANFITAKRALSAVCKFGGVVGPTGSGKSESFKFYRTLNNHGAVIHVEAPANGRLSSLQTKIAHAYHVGITQLIRNREASIRENVNETRCIIIDNTQDLYDPSAGSRQQCFNWLRELQDDTRCSIILSFTEDFLKTDLTAGLAKGYFEQFIGRMGGESAMLRLPQYKTMNDLRINAASFGLDAGKGAMPFLEKWSRMPGRCRIVFERLQLAQTFAKLDDRERITIADLEEADQYTPPSVSSIASVGGAS